MQPTLLILAAGMGSRYGGLKQIDPVGPGGETMLDYAVFDALRAGFGRLVFVIRREFEALFRERVGSRYAGRAAVDYVYQGLHDLPSAFVAPAGREKPWGTAHAVWCARASVRENFAVINADDFYGATSFQALADFLQSRSTNGTVAPGPADAAVSGGVTARVPGFALVGFRLANTLSEHGAVSRGICQAGATGALESIVERTGIFASDVGAGRPFSGAETVSMNCWGFTPALFRGLDEQLREFLARQGGDLKSEFYLPAAVSTMIARRQAVVQVLPTESAWFGITYREDKPRVVAAIAALVQRGHYPAQLFS